VRVWLAYNSTSFLDLVLFLAVGLPAARCNNGYYDEDHVVRGSFGVERVPQFVELRIVLLWGNLCFTRQITINDLQTFASVSDRARLHMVPCNTGL